MNIAIDMHVVTGIPQGSATYLVNMVQQLISLQPSHNYFLFAFDIKAAEKVMRLKGSPANVHFIRLRFRNPVLRLFLEEPLLCRLYKIDLVFNQYIISPFHRKIRKIVTIHDVLFEKYPEFYPFVFRLRSHFLFRYSARNADFVLTVSQYSARQITKTYSIPETKVLITSNAIDHSTFKPSTRSDPALNLSRVINSDYILTVGRISPNKNHIRLINAFRKLQMNYHNNTSLIIVGHFDRNFKEYSRKLKSMCGEGVCIFETINNPEELAEIYQSSLFVAFPSLAEGFGIPVLEAMACGKAVLASRETSLPEIIGDAGLYVDAFDVEDITRGLSKLSDSNFRRTLEEKSITRARQFSWNRSATVLGNIISRMEQ